LRGFLCLQVFIATLRFHHFFYNYFISPVFKDTRDKEDEISAATGYTAHIVSILSKYLEVPAVIVFVLYLQALSVVLKTNRFLYGSPST
jgi:hypothetical protein